MFSRERGPIINSRTKSKGFLPAMLIQWLDRFCCDDLENNFPFAHKRVTSCLRRCAKHRLKLSFVYYSVLYSEVAGPALF